MSSPGEKRGSSGHAMASFDGHAFCARCRDKKKGEDPCIKNPERECNFVPFSPVNNCNNFRRPLIDSRRKKERQRKWILLPVKTLR